MKSSNLVPRKSSSTLLFRSIIPKDLILFFGGRTRFHISLKNVSNKETKYVSIFLKRLVNKIYNEVRMGKSLTAGGLNYAGGQAARYLGGAGFQGNPFTGEDALIPIHTIIKGDMVSLDWGPHPWGWAPADAN